MDCPICKKSGLPDFYKSRVVCPQCNSDLYSFTLIGESNKLYLKERRKSLLLLAILSVVVIALIFSLLYHQPNSSNKSEKPLSQNIDSLSNKFDSILICKNEEIKVLKVSLNLKEVGYFPYVVKKGDNLSRIAYIFYNDWSLYKQIKVDNNLDEDYVIHPLDTLLIRIKLEKWEH
jgi:hypothetical protein